MSILRVVLFVLPLLVGCNLVLPLVERPTSVDALPAKDQQLPDLAPDSGGSCVTTLASGLSSPLGLALDLDGLLLVADGASHRVLRVAADGTVSPVAGSGTPGYLDATPATAGELDTPSDVAVDGQGVIYIADSGNNLIRKVTQGELHTHAGSNIAGFKDGSIYTAQFNAPAGLALDGWGVLYVADTENNRVRRISGEIVSGLSPTLTRPRAVAVDGVGTLHVTQDHQVALMPGSPLSVLAGSTEAGFAEGSLEKARFNNPRGIVVDGGVVYVADRDNHRIRKIASGQVTTLAGRGSPGATDGTLAAASFNGPTGLVLDRQARRLYVADTGNGSVRVLTCGL